MTLTARRGAGVERLSVVAHQRGARGEAHQALIRTGLVWGEVLDPGPRRRGGDGGAEAQRRVLDSVSLHSDALWAPRWPAGPHASG
eukprot:gene672-biopygen909